MAAPLAGGAIQVDVTMTKLFEPDLVIGWEVLVLPASSPGVLAGPAGSGRIGDC